MRHRVFLFFFNSEKKSTKNINDIQNNEMSEKSGKHASI
jgi:hypothetical protein